MMLTKKRLKDIIYTLLIAFAIISFWRGVWGLMDAHLFPGNKTLSFAVSIIIGILILFSTENKIKSLV